MKTKDIGEEAVLTQMDEVYKIMKFDRNSIIFERVVLYLEWKPIWKRVNKKMKKGAKHDRIIERVTKARGNKNINIIYHFLLKQKI